MGGRSEGRGSADEGATRGGTSVGGVDINSEGPCTALINEPCGRMFNYGMSLRFCFTSCRNVRVSLC